MGTSVDEWHFLLVGASIANVLFSVYAARSKKLPPSAPPERHSLQKRLFALSMPVVFECVWRSVFPSLYLQRFVFFDTPLSSILLLRTFACVGELTWNGALALCIVRIDCELTGGRRWVRASAAALFLTYVVAEGFSFYNTATTNELFAAIEVGTDALSQLLCLPAAAWMAATLYGQRRLTSSSGGLFLCAFCLLATLYPLYNFAIDVPMYLERYRADQAAGKQYLAFGQGLVDAATRRIATRASKDWQADMSWMVMYFVFNPLGATALAIAAPTTTQPVQPTQRARRARGTPQEKLLVVSA